MAKKNIYWLLEDNGDLSITLENLDQVKEQIEAYFEEDKNHSPVKEIQYTVTPVEMTERQFNNLPEFNG